MAAVFVYGLMLVLSAGALFVSTFSATYDLGEPYGGDVTTVFVPRVFLILWMIFAVLMVVEEVVRGRAKLRLNVDWTPLGLACLAAIVIAAAMLQFGFVLALVPGFFVFTWLLGYRRPVPLAIVSIAMPAVVWGVFIHFFELSLPQSPWFDVF